jgi:hypothetical protein
MLSFLYIWRESIINMDDKRCNWDLKKNKKNSIDIKKF